VVPTTTLSRRATDRGADSESKQPVTCSGIAGCLLPTSPKSGLRSYELDVNGLNYNAAKVRDE